MELRANAPSLNSEDKSATLSQEREMAVQQGTANLNPSLKKIDQLVDSAINCLSQDELAFIKKEISEFAYKQCGNLANIQDIHYDTQQNKISATVDIAYTIHLDLNEHGFSKSPEVCALLGQIQSVEREHSQLVKDCSYLGSMIDQAIDFRQTAIDQREQEIIKARSGLNGLWDSLMGQLPKPIPSLEEIPLTQHDITQTLHVPAVKTESFLKLLDEHLPNIQRDAYAATKDLEKLVVESKADLEKLQASVAHAIQQTTPEISPTVQIEKQVTAFLQDHPELDPEAIKQHLLEERSLAVNDPNSALQEDSALQKLVIKDGFIYATYQTDGQDYVASYSVEHANRYFENEAYQHKLATLPLLVEYLQSTGSVAAAMSNYSDFAKSTVLHHLAESIYDQNILIENLELASLDQQKGELVLHFGNGQIIGVNMKELLTYDGIKGFYSGGINAQNFVTPEVAENSIGQELKDILERLNVNEQLRHDFMEKIATLSTMEKFSYLATNPLGLSDAELAKSVKLMQEIATTQIQDTSITGIIKESLLVDKDDGLAIVTLKRGTAVTVGVSKGAGEFVTDVAVGVDHAINGAANYIVYSTISSADYLSGNFLSNNFEYVQNANRYVNGTNDQVVGLVGMAYDAGITGIAKGGFNYVTNSFSSIGEGWQAGDIDKISSGTKGVINTATIVIPAGYMIKVGYAKGIGKIEGTIDTVKALSDIPKGLETKALTSEIFYSRFNTYGDKLREKLGSAKISHPTEYIQHMDTAKKLGVVIVERQGTLAYEPRFGGPGRLILDPEASIGAVRHELRHVLDDFDLGFPGFRIMADSEAFWKLEFRGYMEEINLAREIKEFGVAREVLKEMRLRKSEIFGHE